MLPTVAVGYLTQVFFLQHPPSAVGLRSSKELRTLARCIDLICRNDPLRSLEVMIQRLKAIELSHPGQLAAGLTVGTGIVGGSAGDIPAGSQSSSARGEGGLGPATRRISEAAAETLEVRSAGDRGRSGDRRRERRRRRRQTPRQCSEGTQEKAKEKARRGKKVGFRW